MNHLESQIVSLATVPPGRTVRVVSLTGGMTSEGRLRDMGLSLGTEVQVLVAGNRSPLLVAAGETRLAIEPDLARRVWVHCLDGERGRPGRHRKHRGWHHRWRMR